MTLFDWSVQRNNVRHWSPIFKNNDEMKSCAGSLTTRTPLTAIEMSFPVTSISWKHLSFQYDALVVVSFEVGIIDEIPWARSTHLAFEIFDGSLPMFISSSNLLTQFWGRFKLPNCELVFSPTSPKVAPVDVAGDEPVPVDVAGDVFSLSAII